MEEYFVIQEDILLLCRLVIYNEAAVAKFQKLGRYIIFLRNVKVIVSGEHLRFNLIVKYQPDLTFLKKEVCYSIIQSQKPFLAMTLSFFTVKGSSITYLETKVILALLLIF